MRFGTGKDIITPVAPMNVACNGVFDKPFVWVHDDVYVRCLVLDDGKEKAVLMAFDLLFHDHVLNDQVAAYAHEKYLPKYGCRLAALHLHDNRCGVDTDDHLLPFEGAIPMEEVAKDLVKSGYRGTLMLEIGRLIETHTYDEMSEEDYMDRAAAAAFRLNDLVESYR